MYTPDINRDLDEVKAFEVFKDLVRPFKNTLSEYYDNVDSSVELGTALYNGNVSPIRLVWDNERNVYVFSFWHNLYKDLQTADDLIKFIEALYIEANVTIDVKAPLVLSFGVDANHTIEVWWNRDGRYNLETIPGNLKEFDDPRDVQIFVKDSDDDEDARGLIFDFVSPNISESALSTILRDVIYPGLYYDTTVIK